jgi:hypothetical protein
VAGDDDGGDIHAYGGPTFSTRAGAPSSDLVSYISLFKKTIVITGLADVSRTIAMTLASSLLWYHSSDGIVATDHLPVAIVGYAPWLQ